MNETEAALIKQEALRLKSEGVPAESGRLLDLFDYLVERTLAGAPPKEAEIAAVVFEREIVADGDDSSVRVYIHRLRKRLEDYYLRNPELAQTQLKLPRGDYQFVLSDGAMNRENTQTQTVETTPKYKWQPALWAKILAGLAVLNLAGWLVFMLLNQTFGAAQKIPDVWTELIESDRELAVVLGDYYIFGEFEDGLFLQRLIRDFEINSADDLRARLQAEPDLIDRYNDISLEYLPVSSAFAMDDLSPLISLKRKRIVQASQLDPETMKCCDILYIGLTSGLGSLEQQILRDGRFRLGDTYDEIVDTETDELYVSEAFLSAPGETVYRDYAIFSVYEGPAGTTIWSIAGTRDTGLIGLSEWLMSPEKAGALELSGNEMTPGYSALFEITGQKHLNLGTKLIAENDPTTN
ncbi:MAG: hypothetical protein CMK09_01050 [Ponticaulis sp.]|nr:hypothetical protein [Ponticaulis sp.]